MLLNSNELIEDFASMLEQSSKLNETMVAEKTFHFMMMLSFSPELRPMMKNISVALKELLCQSDAIGLTNATTDDANKMVAAKIRALKQHLH